MKKLSVALAVYNEEKNIRRCLDSLLDFADEIVIVDGSSTDKTVDIAKLYTKHIIVTSNPTNFHINKQKALDACKNPWILQLDADEVVSHELKKEISLSIQKDDCDGYWIPRKNFFLGRFLMKGGQYPDYTLRLYKKGKGKLPQKDVHEQAIVEGKIGYLKSPLLHYPYKNFKMYLYKWNRYNNIFAYQIRDTLRKKNILYRFYYGVGYLLIKPTHWFLTTYLRHKGFMDYWQGFVFSLFSALRFPVSYIKYLFIYEKS